MKLWGNLYEFYDNIMKFSLKGLTNHYIEEHQELDVSCHSGICPIGILIKYQDTLSNSDADDRLGGKKV